MGRREEEARAAACPRSGARGDGMLPLVTSCVAVERGLTGRPWMSERSLRVTSWASPERRAFTDVADQCLVEVVLGGSASVLIEPASLLGQPFVLNRAAGPDRLKLRCMGSELHRGLPDPKNDFDYPLVVRHYGVTTRVVRRRPKCVNEMRTRRMTAHAAKNAGRGTRSERNSPAGGLCLPLQS